MPWASTFTGAVARLRQSSPGRRAPLPGVRIATNQVPVESTVASCSAISASSRAASRAAFESLESAMHRDIGRQAGALDPFGADRADRLAGAAERREPGCPAPSLGKRGRFRPKRGTRDRCGSPGSVTSDAATPENRHAQYCGQGRIVASPRSSAGSSELEEMQLQPEVEPIGQRGRSRCGQRDPAGDDRRQRTRPESPAHNRAAAPPAPRRASIAAAAPCPTGMIRATTPEPDELAQHRLGPRPRSRPHRAPERSRRPAPPPAGHWAASAGPAWPPTHPRD